jgi:mono/diheme cytochrome c family protein
MAMKNRQQTLRRSAFMVSGWKIFALLLLAVVLFFLPGRVKAQDEIDQEKLQQGAELYSQNCAVCHGPNGEGRVGVTLSKDWPSIRPDLTIKNTIMNGVPGSPMPAWSQENGGPLADEQIDAIVYYIMSWQSSGLELVEPFPTPTPRLPMTPIPGLEGDPNQGGILYDQNCAVCHGSQGGDSRCGAG